MACLAALVGLGVVVGESSAAERVASVSGDLEAGPYLVGDEVAWQASRCVRNCSVYEEDGYCEDQTLSVAIRFSRVGRRPRTLASARNDCFDSGPSSSSVGFRFGLSRSHFVLEREESAGSEEGYGSATTLRAGPIGGPLRRLKSCSGDETYTSFALGGSRLLYNASPCPEPTTKLTMLNLASGKFVGVPVEKDFDVYQAEVAGRYVALGGQSSDGSQIVVFDLARRDFAYRAALPRGSGSQFALRRDGTLASLTSTSTPKDTPRYCTRAILRMYSPRAPKGRRVPASACLEEPHFAGEQIVYVAPAKKRGRAVRITTAGGKARTLLRFGYDSAIYNLDANKNRLAFAAPRCSGGWSLHTQPLEPTRQVAGSPRCFERSFRH